MPFLSFYLIGPGNIDTPCCRQNFFFFLLAKNLFSLSLSFDCLFIATAWKLNVFKLLVRIESQPIQVTTALHWDAISWKTRLSISWLLIIVPLILWQTRLLILWNSISWSFLLTIIFKKFKIQVVVIQKNHFKNELKLTRSVHSRWLWWTKVWLRFPCRRGWARSWRNERFLPGCPRSRKRGSGQTSAPLFCQMLPHRC